MDWLRFSSWGTAPSVARSLPAPAALASAVMKSSGVVLAETSMGGFNFNILAGQRHRGKCCRGAQLASPLLGQQWGWVAGPWDEY